MPLQTKRNVLWLVVYLVGVLAIRAQESTHPLPEVISLTDAEILIYLLPQARDVRNQGGEISWKLESGVSQNTRDFYNFWVVGPLKPGEASNTIGYFSVNKQTAEIWNAVLGKRISDEEVQGVQKILREGHHIDAQTLNRYRNVKP